MDKQTIIDLMNYADRMKHSIRRYSKLVCVLDKSISYQAAAMKLGCPVLVMEDQDAAECYGDVIVPLESLTESDRLAELYALVRELSYRGISIDSTDRDTLHVTFLGYSRSVHPFVQLLNHFPKIECHFVSRIEIEQGLLEKTDVFYVSLKQEGDVYCLNKAFLNKTKHTSIVMRTYPFEKEVIDNPRCIYSTQDRYGLYLRMAILDRSLAKLSWPSLYESYWMAVDSVSNLAVSYIVKGLSMFSFSPLVRTGV